MLDSKTIHVGSFEARWKEIPPHPVNFFVMFYPDGHIGNLEGDPSKKEYCAMYACEANTWYEHEINALSDNGNRVLDPLFKLVANYFNDKVPEPNNADLIISKKVLNGELDLFEGVDVFIPDGWDVRKEGLNPLFPYKASA